ncbi:UNVERIFIED_CONTAM: hypothetical protein RMT77_013853 [Armadillidium vulgare]
MPAILGYWNVRGLGHYIRFILEYTGEDYVEKIYGFGPAPEYSKSNWRNEQFDHGLDFPNLPYYIDGDVKLTQSVAILKHIARKHNLLPKTDAEISKADMLEYEAMDLKMGFIRLTLGQDYEEKKNDFIEQIMEPKLTCLSKWLGNNDWFLGSKILYVDFLIYETLFCLNVMSPSSFDKFENLKKFLNRFENLERIKNYMKSDRYFEHPFNGPMYAAYNGK